ncbi:Ig-like domain-containing protein [Candidatus Albibeggiatoa sp. nov. BB20]|uniref:beta strand repeat-containing protein n=1 Tax=Candidatus Albibeggiatoa sp. nov. BB20 TaxID=3162723 RepID=UPI00336570BA
MLLMLTACVGGGGGSSTTTQTEDEIIQANVAKVVLLIQDNNQLADGQAVVTLTAIARDSNNNPIANVPISFSSQSDSAILTPFTGTTSAQGVLTTVISNTQIEFFLVSASAGNKTSEFVTVNFIEGIEVNKITLLVNNNNQLANNSTPITLTAIARNTDNLPIPDIPIDFISSSDTVILTPFTGTTNEQGILTTSISSNTAQTFRVLARSGSVQSPEVSLSFNDGNINIAKIILLVSDNNQPANGQSEINLTAIARDENNTPIPNITLGFNSNSETAIFSQFSGQTNNQGIVTSSITNTIPETLDVYAQASTVNSEVVRLTFVNSLTDGRVDTINLTVTNNFQRADGTSTVLLDVTARDSQGDLIPNVQINLSPQSDTAIFATLSGLTNESGHFTTSVTSTLAEIFDVTPIAGGVRGQAQEITFIAPADGLVLNTDNTALATNQSANLTLTLYQGKTDPIPLAGANFSVQVTGTAKTKNVPQTTDATGQARFQISNSKAENVTVTATSGQFEQQLNLYFGANLTLLPSESNAVTTSTLSAILKDVNQTAIVGQPINFSFVGNNNETLSSNQVLTGNDGVASVTVNDVQSDGGQVTVKAASGAIETQAKVNFNAAFGENRTLALSSSSNLLGSNDTAIVIARVIDNNGLPVAGQVINFSGDDATINPLSAQTNADGEASTRVKANRNVQITANADTAQQTIPLYFGASISLIPESANGTADGSTATAMTAIVTDSNGAAIQGIPVNFQITEGSGFLQGSPAVTNENGRAEVGLISTNSDPISLQAITGNLTSNNSQVRFFATGINPDVTAIELIVSNSPQIADGQGQIQITAIVRDANNQALVGIPINFVSSSNSAFFSAISGVSAENGRFSSTVTNNVVEEFSVTANAGGTSSAPASLVFNALAVNNISIQTSETVLNLQDQVAVTVALFNNVQDSQQALANTPFTASISGNATLNDVPERTDNNGQARFTVINNTVENVTLTVVSGTTLQSVDLYFGSSLVLLPNVSTVSSETVLTALLKDGNNTPLDNETIRFSFAASNNETLSPTEAVTNSQGVATVSITDLNNDGGSALVQALRGSLNAQAQVNFTTQLANGSRLLISAPNQIIPVDKQADVIAQMTNELGQALSNQFVIFSATTQDNNITDVSLDPARGSTDATGQIQTKVSSSKAQNINVTAQVSSINQTIPIYFGAKLSLSPLQASVAADAELSAIMIVTITDAFNTPIPNVQVNFNYYFDVNEDETFTEEELQNTLTVLSNELGQAVMNIQSTQQGKGQVIANAGLLDSVSASIEFTELPPQRIILSAEKQDLTLTEQTQIIATVVDKYGNPVQGENVAFSANTGTIGGEAISAENGQAQVNYAASTKAGTAVITARINDEISSILNLNIQSGDAGAIEVSNIEPRELGVLGSGTAQTTTIEFTVKDNAGNPVDGRTVQFSLGDTGLSGGESLIFNSAISSNGVVSTILRTGVVSGTVDVIASVKDSDATAIARIPIVSNTPDARHLSLAAEYLNIAGGVQFGLEDTVTAYVGDRYGNVVASDTSVSFITEGGLIGQSVGQAFTTTTVLGRASAILQSAAPTTPNLGGVPFISTIGYECNLPFSLISGASQSMCGNPGFVTVIAYTTGSESYTDLNGNGQYDANEPFEDLTEPYIDANDNGQFDEGEIYVDVNQNSRFTIQNGQFESNTTIWTATQFLFSDRTQIPTITPNSFDIPNDGAQQFIVSGFDGLSLSDVYGNALVAGTKLTITTSGGVLGGAVGFEINDSVGRGLPEFSFILSSEPPDKDGVYPERKNVVITLSITAGDTNAGSAPGGNGDVILTIGGSINN